MTLQAPGVHASVSAASRFAYDVFVVHADAATDQAFVNGYLLANLGLAPERVLRLQTLELGQGITAEIERGVRSSRVTIVVLSAAYMDDHWAVFGEQLAAFASVAKDLQGVLLPLLLEDCKLTMHVASLVKLDFRDPTREVWEAEIGRLRGYLNRPAAPEPGLDCPYPGMRSFTESDAGRFFGREIELDNIEYRLHHGDGEIYVIGASGSGKSSLVSAGLVPRLTRGALGLPRFLVRSFRPGERPLERLASALDGDVTEPANAVGQLLTRHPPATSLLLAIDQLEELFVIAGDAQRHDFLAVVRALRADPRCVLLFTLRADFYGAFLTSSLWTDNEGRISRIDLGPLGRDSLRVTIESPARDVGVYVEPQLVSRLLDEAAQEPGALPLLQETLFQLWDKRRQRLLTLADYHALSKGARTGLAFAVEKHADFVLGRLTPEQQVIAFRILLRLVNFGEGRADTRRQQPCDALRSESETVASFDAVLKCLVEQRLVTVTGDDQHRDVRVDLAHEILIQAWPAFADKIQTWRALEQRRRELETAAAAWRMRGSGDGGLLDAVELAGAIVWRNSAVSHVGHSADLAGFLGASEAAQSRMIKRRRLTFAGLSLLAVVTSILALVAWRQANEADRQRQDALEQRDQRDRLVAESVQLYQETGRQLLLEAERPLEALPYLVEARARVEAIGGTPSAALRTLFAQAMQNFPVSLPLPHQGRVASAAFSPDGTRVVTASEDKTARIWDAGTGKPISPPLPHQDRVVSVAFSPDGTRVVTASEDKTARVWDAGTGKPISPPLPHQGSVASAAFSPDGTRVVTASWDNTARVWDAGTGKPVSPLLPHQDIVLSATFSPDGTRVVTADDDKTARIWDAGTGMPIFPPLQHQASVVSAAFSPDGTRVVTASDDHTARVWDTGTGKPLPLPLQHQASVRSAVFSPDGSRVVTASDDHTARVWNAGIGQPILLLPHQDRVVSPAFSPDGIRVVTASADKTARVWDASISKPISPPLQHQASVLSAAFSPDGTRVVTASADKTACVWDAGTGKPLSSPLQHQASVLSAAFSPDGTRVVTASEDNTARIWDAGTGKLLSPPLQHQGTVRSAAFSPDGTRVVTASWDKTTRVWDAGTGKPLSPPFQHQGIVRSAAFSPDGPPVVTASEDKTARIWDATGKPLSPPLQHQGIVRSAAFSPDGTRVVTASEDKTARVWDAGTGKPVSPPLQHQASVVSAAFSPDGTRVVTASWDNTARVWDADTGKPVSPPLLHQGSVVSAVFSPDGTRVVTASWDNTARVWDVPLASGTLAEWRAIMDHASPYVLVNGVLSLRSTINGSAVSSAPSLPAQSTPPP